MIAVILGGLRGRGVRWFREFMNRYLLTDFHMCGIIMCNQEWFKIYISA